jgi:hypothetical protein
MEIFVKKKLVIDIETAMLWNLPRTIHNGEKPIRGVHSTLKRKRHLINHQMPF